MGLGEATAGRSMVAWVWTVSCWRSRGRSVTGNLYQNPDNSPRAGPSALHLAFRPLVTSPGQFGGERTIPRPHLFPVVYYAGLDRRFFMGGLHR
jgi:hypothetical protein